MSLRFLAVPLLACGLLAGCGFGDDGDDEGKEASSARQSPAPTEPGPEPSASGAIEFATVERLTPGFLSRHPNCPPGEFKATEAFLTTLPKGATRNTKSPPQSYSCGGRVDQVVFADFEDPADARALLSPKNTANSASFVAGTVVVLVNFGLEDKVDIAGFFKQIRRECDCGRTRYKPSRRRNR